MTLIAWVNGEFVPLQKARISVMDRGFMYGDGIFETLYARGNQIFRLEGHLNRLENSALDLHIPLPCPKNEIGDLIQETLSRNDLKEAMVRIQITRGEGPPGLLFPETARPSLVIQVRSFREVPPSLYNEGVPVCTVPASAIRISLLNQQAKSCNYLSNILMRNRAREAGCFEALFLDSQNRLTEGTTTNVFIVRDNRIKTPPTGEYVLNGITRRVVFEICAEQNFEIEEKPVTLPDALDADELFLTNSGVGVLPVNTIDQQKVGNGKPGNLTEELTRSYFKIVDSELGSC